MRVTAPLLRALATAAIAAAAGAAQAHDYPTSERVIYVEACMRDHPGACLLYTSDAADE